MWGVLVLGTIIMVIKINRGQSPNEIFSLFFGMVATAALYMAVQTKK